MQDPGAQAVPGTIDEITATGEHRERGAGGGRHEEDGGEGEAVLHAQITGQAEGHGIHGKGSAEAHAAALGLTDGTGGFGRPQQVTELAGFLRKGGGVALARFPFEADAAGMRADPGAEGAGLALEKPFQ